MPIAKNPTELQTLRAKSRDQLLAIIDGLNSSGKYISRQGNKPLLVQRIINSRNPGQNTRDIKANVAKISPSNFPDVPDVSTLDDKQQAVRTIQQLREVREMIKLECDPLVEDWKAQAFFAKRGLENVLSFISRHCDPIDCKITEIKSKVKVYEQREQKRLEEEQSRIQKLLREKVENAVDRLREEGNIDEADALASAPIEYKPIYETSYSWRIVDLKEVKEGFFSKLPDNREINRCVKKNGVKAEEIVGGITVDKRFRRRR